MFICCRCPEKKLMDGLEIKPVLGAESEVLCGDGPSSTVETNILKNVSSGSTLKERNDLENEVLSVDGSVSTVETNTLKSVSSVSTPREQRLPKLAKNASSSFFPFVLKFRTCSGEIMEMDCASNQFPLGINFKNQTPVEVARVQAGSVAEEFGVVVGW